MEKMKMATMIITTTLSITTEINTNKQKQKNNDSNTSEKPCVHIYNSATDCHKK